MSPGSADERRRTDAFASFDEFKTAFDLTIREAIDRHKVSVVLTFLRRQTSFHLSTAQAELILEQMRVVPERELVEFSLLVQSYLTPRPSRPLAAVAAEIGRRYRVETRFLDYCGDEGGAGGFLACLRQWIVHLRAPAVAGDRGSSVGGPELRIVRMGFGCLLTRLEKGDFSDSILTLLRSFFARNDPKSATESHGRASAVFAGSLSAVLRLATPKRKQVELVLDATEALQEQAKRAERERNRTEMQLQSSREDCTVMTEEIAKLQEDLATRSKDGVALQARIQALDALVLEERKKTEALDQHWQAVLEQEKAGLASRLHGQLAHEVSEIQLCLSGTDPNLEMASRRIARVSDMVAALKGK